MRTMEEIQTEILQVEREIAQLEREISYLESNEGKMARRQYVDTGDKSGYTELYNRAYQIQKDEYQKERDRKSDQFQDRQLRIQEREADKADTERENNKQKLIDAALESVIALRTAKKGAEEKKTNEAIGAYELQSHKTKTAIRDALAAGADGSLFEGVEYYTPEPTVNTPTKYDFSAFSQGQYDNTVSGWERVAKSKVKLYIPDAEYDQVVEYYTELGKTADGQEAGKKGLDRMSALKKYRESDRKSREGKGAKELAELQAAFDKLSPRQKANAAEKGFIYNGKTYEVVKNTDGTYHVLTGKLKGGK